MPCTLPQLRGLLEAEGLHYYLIPDRDGVMLTVKGTDARFQFKILVEEEGDFLQFRSIDFLSCPMDHPHLDATLKVLGETNYRLRLIKFGWDPTDGEIAAYVDTWLMDGELTQAQFSRMANAFMSILDDEFATLQRAIESGVGPEISEPGVDDTETIDTL